MNNKNKINNIEIDNKLNFRFTKFIYFIGLFMMFLGYVVVFLINANDMNFQKNNFQIVI
jgi:quinol-cytochrome oxidoreductase complex cytochrome b subunit